MPIKLYKVGTRHLGFHLDLHAPGGGGQASTQCQLAVPESIKLSIDQLMRSFEWVWFKLCFLYGEQ